MINYIWNINQLERNVSDSGVVVAHWRCTGTDSDTEATASNYGTVSFQPDPASADFVPFDQLTEEQVLGWVHESVDKDATETALADQIDKINNPTTTTGKPWE